jgi:multidrug resistance efflux pump
MTRTLRRAFILLAVGLTTVVALACGKGAADQAIAAASATLDKAKPELERYVPDDLKALSESLSKTRAAFDKGDYKGALASAQALLERIQAAAAAATKKKDELMASFNQLKESLPKMAEALKARLARLAKSTNLPAGLDQATVETAQANLESATQGWTEALSQFDKGDVVAAMARANDVKVRMEEMAKVFLPQAPAKK